MDSSGTVKLPVTEDLKRAIVVDGSSMAQLPVPISADSKEADMVNGSDSKTKTQFEMTRGSKLAATISITAAKARPRLRTPEFTRTLLYNLLKTSHWLRELGISTI